MLKETPILTFVDYNILAEKPSRMMDEKISLDQKFPYVLQINVCKNTLKMKYIPFFSVHIAVLLELKGLRLMST